MNMITRDSTAHDTHNHEFDAPQAEALHELRNQIAKMNAAVKRAVDSGLIIELTRASRHHSPQQCWGDQMSPKVTKTMNSPAA